MTRAQFDAAYRAFCRRVPFRPFLVEFTSGNQSLISHPEAVRAEPNTYVLRSPDSGYVVFAAESVPRSLDLPRKSAE